MTNTFRQHAAKGFTLIELLIVVIIIAILAAIAIPQFGNSTSEATDSALDANLATVRSAVELYRVQHNNNFPGLVATTVATGCTSGGLAAAANSADAFRAQMTMYSNRAGQTCSVPLAGLDYGPYLREMPRDPITPANDVTGAQVAVSAGVLTDPAATVPGWRFSTLDGHFDMHSVALDRNGRAYHLH